MAATHARPSTPRARDARAKAPPPRPPAQRPGATTRIRAARLVPPWRVVAGAWIAAAAVGGAYAIARETPIFAIRHITVEGVPPPLADAVRQAVSAYRGASLVSLDGSGVLGRVDALPTVSGARYDRAFPNTLRIVVTAERPVAVLRAGTGSWLVSTRARVLRTITRTVDRELPRIWIPAGTPVVVGATLSQDAGGAAARALAPLARSGFPARITAVTLADGELRFELAGGVELRLGRPDDLRLKLAVARRIVRLLPQGTTYLDVSVPQRPVSGGNTQVSG